MRNTGIIMDVYRLRQLSGACKRVLKTRPGGWALILFLLTSCLILPSACTGWEQKRASALRTLGRSPEEVKKQVGEPSVVARTKEDTTLWIYRPPYKLKPDQEGSVYLEFRDGKVSRSFVLR